MASVVVLLVSCGSSITTTVAPENGLADCLAQLSLAVRVGQVLVPVVEQSEITTSVLLAERGLLGGVVVVGKPNEEIVGAISVLQESSMTGPLVIAVDEEGGSVQRLDTLLGRLPSASDMTELEPRQIELVVADHTEEIARLGFTVVLAPVLDVGAGPGIGSRSFGDNPDVVVTYGRAFAEGVIGGGLTPVAKHFPGHGRADADSHEVLPVTPPFSDLVAFDLLPWQSLVEETAVMVGHLVVPDLTGGLPASLSVSAIGGLLREELNFGGVVFTDDLAMNAIREIATIPEAAVMSLVAGADLLVAGGIDGVITIAWEILAALDDGRLKIERLNEAVQRAFTLRGVNPCNLLS